MTSDRMVIEERYCVSIETNPHFYRATKRRENTRLSIKALFDQSLYTSFNPTDRLSHSFDTVQSVKGVKHVVFTDQSGKGVIWFVIDHCA